MKSNSIWRVLAFVVGLLGFLFLLRFMPEITIFDKKLKTIDLLSDITTKEAVDKYLPKVIDVKDSVSIDTIVAKDSVGGIKDMVADKSLISREQSVIDGIVAIKEYSDSTQRGMKPFYDAIKRMKREGGNLRIAYFGDSFIEGDIITAELRRKLQNKYGGDGVGLVPITSEVSEFRKSVVHKFDNWETHTVMDKNGFDEAVQGLGSSYFLPEKDAYVQLKQSKRYMRKDNKVDRVEAIMLALEDIDVHVETNVSVNDYHVKRNAGVQRIVVNEPDITNVKLTTNKSDSVYFYGVSMDSSEGVILDNFAMRGSSGMNIYTVPTKVMRGFNKVRPYDLIVLEFGLNVVNEGRKHYDGYTKAMGNVVRKLKKNFPNAGFLLVGISDRCYKNDDGEITTMPEVKYFMQYQEQIASNEKIAYWNLFEAMGGENSIKEWAEQSPPLANKDYTHLTFLGGRKIAAMIFDAMMRSVEE